MIKIECPKTAFLVELDEFNVIGWNRTDIIRNDIFADKRCYWEFALNVAGCLNTGAICICDPGAVDELIFIEFVIDVRKSKVGFNIVGVCQDLIRRFKYELRFYERTARNYLSYSSEKTQLIIVVFAKLNTPARLYGLQNLEAGCFRINVEYFLWVMDH